MDTNELKNIWDAYDAKLEKSLKLNLHLIETIQAQKIRSSFQSLMRLKIFGIVIGILWNAFIGFLLYWHHSEPFFIVSAILVILFSCIAIAGYINQMLLIKQINYSGSITGTQKQLALLESSIIRLTRFQFLQAPIYTVFYIRIHMIAHAGITYWIIQITITVFFILLSVWLYRNISFKNINRRWVKALIQDEGGKSIAKAREFIKEIEEFKKEAL